MIIGNEELYVRGNTVLKPEKVKIENEKSKKYEKFNEQRKQLKLKEEKRNKVKMISYIFMFFIVGFTVIYRYSLIYGVQKEYVETRQSVALLQKENENLRVNLIKLEDNEEINNKIASMKMVNANKAACASVDLDKAVFNEKKENKTEGGVLSYIKQLFS